MIILSQPQFYAADADRHWSISQIAAPDEEEETVTVADMVHHSRLNMASGDAAGQDLVKRYIRMARETVENLGGFSLAPQSWRLSLETFPLYVERSSWFWGVIELPRAWPLTKASVVVKYTDPDGAPQTLATNKYEVDDQSKPGRVMPAYGLDWPATRSCFNAVQIEYDAGFTDKALVPEVLKGAVILAAAHFYENREPILLTSGRNVATKLPYGLEAMIWQHRCSCALG
jgi:uncharacterized phiE125 gp8 family phage protein